MGKPIPEEEIRRLMSDRLWGTLIAVDSGRPYAVETSFAHDEKHLYTGTKLGGRMHRCIQANPAAAFNICDGDHRGHNYRSAIVESSAEILTRREDILYGLRIIFTKLGLPTDKLEARADSYVQGKGALALYRLPLEGLGGIRSGA